MFQAYYGGVEEIPGACMARNICLDSIHESVRIISWVKRPDGAKLLRCEPCSEKRQLSRTKLIESQAVFRGTDSVVSACSTPFDIPSQEEIAQRLKVPHPPKTMLKFR